MSDEGVGSLDDLRVGDVDERLTLTNTEVFGNTRLLTRPFGGKGAEKAETSRREGSPVHRLRPQIPLFCFLVG